MCQSTGSFTFYFFSVTFNAPQTYKHVAIILQCQQAYEPNDNRVFLWAKVESLSLYWIWLFTPSLCYWRSDTDRWWFTPYCFKLIVWPSLTPVFLRYCWGTSITIHVLLLDGYTFPSLNVAYLLAIINTICRANTICGFTKHSERH